MATVDVPEPLDSLTARWDTIPVTFERGKTPLNWTALLGTGLADSAGPQRLSLHGRRPGGSEFESEQVIDIAAVRFPSSRLKVAPGFVEQDSQVVRRIRRERALKDSVFAAGDGRPAASGRSLPPVPGRTSERYGTQRVFNGEKQSVHEGLDFRAPPGTRVHALQPGRVALARRLFFEGNCVFLDHGDGLFTLYMHFSKIMVREGERVKAGDVLGRSGATGRVTGPHLHLGVRWKGIPVDPASLILLRLPARGPWESLRLAPRKREAKVGAGVRSLSRHLRHARLKRI